MASNWKTYSLGDIADIGSSKRIKMADYVSKGVPFFRSKEIIEKHKGNAISTELFITEEQFSSIKAKFSAPCEGDILLTSVGTLGVPYQVQCDDRFYFKDGNLTWFRNFKDVVNSRYIYFWLTSALAKRKIDEVTIGSTQQALTIVALKSITIDLPPISIQNAIIKHIDSISRKITLNRQINQTLEQMAQTLFKSWFVDFDPVMDNALDAGNPIPDELQHRAEARKAVRESEGFKPLPEDVRQLFPDAFEESELGWVPKGWGVQRLDVTLDLAYGKALKKTDRIDGDVPVYGSGGVNGTHNVSIVDGPGIIVGRKGTVGSLYWEPNNFYPIDTVFYVKPKSGYSMEYCYELLKTLGLEHMNTDAAVPGLNRNNAYRLVSAKPTPELIELFTQNASVYRSRISHCCSESNTLTKLRDTLLPKLISGELRLDDVEAAVEQETVSAEQQNER
ncbi:restriction endonuclease subunit S [Vibrio cholerae]|nr:restriction endonuclease subunit S [Vibrio cholerae]